MIVSRGSIKPQMLTYYTLEGSFSTHHYLLKFITPYDKPRLPLSSWLLYNKYKAFHNMEALR